MKKLVSLFLALVLLVSLSAPAFAENPNDTAENEIVTASKDPNDPTRLEETMWYYRTTESGLIQKRLWSLTYGYWLTDWITIGYVP